MSSSTKQVERVSHDIASEAATHLGRCPTEKGTSRLAEAIAGVAPVQASHTPGPWTAKTEHGDSDIATVYGCSNGYVNISGSRDWSSMNEVDDIARQHDADLALICAAPDLLEACKEYHRLIHAWRVTGKLPDFGAMAKADDAGESALAKAEGKVL